MGKAWLSALWAPMGLFILGWLLLPISAHAGEERDRTIEATMAIDGLDDRPVLEWTAGKRIRISLATHGTNLRMQRIDEVVLQNTNGPTEFVRMNDLSGIDSRGDIWVTLPNLSASRLMRLANGAVNLDVAGVTASSSSYVFASRKVYLGVTAVKGRVPQSIIDQATHSQQLFVRAVFGDNGRHTAVSPIESTGRFNFKALPSGEVGFEVFSPSSGRIREQILSVSAAKLPIVAEFLWDAPMITPRSSSKSQASRHWRIT